MRQKGNEMMQKFKIRFDTGLCAFMDAKYAVSTAAALSTMFLKESLFYSLK